jgi:nucleoside-diphosphate-sugar epimerase
MTAQSKAARTIVVTGGADGIGRAVVLLCAARGDKVAVLDTIGYPGTDTSFTPSNRLGCILPSSRHGISMILV